MAFVNITTFALFFRLNRRLRSKLRGIHHPVANKVCYAATFDEVDTVLGWLANHRNGPELQSPCCLRWSFMDTHSG